MNHKYHDGHDNPRPSAWSEWGHTNKVTTYLDPELQKAMKIAAIHADITMWEWITQACEDKLAKEM